MDNTISDSVRAAHDREQSRSVNQEKLISIIRETTAPKVMRDQLAHYHISDIADVLEHLTPEERSRLFRLEDAEHLADLLETMDDNMRAPLLKEMNIKKVISILNRMEPDEAADLLKDMDPQRRELLIELMEPEARKAVSLIVSFDEDQIGSQMTTDFVEIPNNISVKEAMRELRRQAKDNDNISILYLHDENGMYYGALRIADLFALRAGDSLEEAVETNFPFVYGTEKISDVMENLKDYAEDSIPVLNNENQILGIITGQDLLDVFDEERSEDYARLAGVASAEDLEESLFLSVRKRLPWLCILLFLGLGVSTVVSMFEGVAAEIPVVVAFQSLVLDMAGNVGTQSLAVTLRVLMDDSLTGKQKLFLALKEARTGLVNGLILGGSSALVLSLYIHFALGYVWLQAAAIAACIGIAMLTSMVISSITGTCIPMFFKAIHVDPAAASGPLITTLNDLIGVVSYYSLVWVMLIQVFRI